MMASGLKELPEAWAAALDQVLQTADAPTLEAVVKAVSTLSGAKLSAAFVSRLQQLSHDERLPAGVRLQSLVALPSDQRQIQDSVLLRFLCDSLAIDKPVAVRALAVDVLLSTPLDPAQVETVAAAVAHAGPMELQRLTELFARSTDERVGLQLLASLEQSPAASSLPLDGLKHLLATYGPVVMQKSEPLIVRIEQENAAKYAKLESILELVADGDIRRGQRVFHDTKAACVACHTMGYLGGRAGPDLTRIGKIRSERDLLESILFPSASFVRSYEPIGIVTTDGKVHNGVILNETASELTLQLDPQKVARIATADIEERLPGTVSIMPAGLDNQLTPRQLADLVTFLKAAQ
jgi:putative heme-binding domain-containing protein